MQFIPSVDFTKNNAAQNEVFPATAPEYTSLFETNIRYLGGLLSAYDLLNGPFEHMVKDFHQVDALLAQAISLADALKFCFDTPSGIPIGMVFIDNQTFTDISMGEDGLWYAGLAEIGTMVLEWQRLSDITGDPSYGELAQKAESHWFNAPEVWPGLTGGLFSVQNGSVMDEYGGWTSGNDSAYEYLLKMYVYDPERYGNYSERWQAAADSTIAHLLSSPNSRPDLTMAGTFAGRTVQNNSQQLACFIGGNFLLGSTVYDRDDYLDAGLKFSEFCANGYRYTASGIGPVLYSWNETVLAGANYTNQTDQYERAGWFIDENLAYGGGQTPEAIESWYYAYQTTGDQYWRDVAWAYTVAQNQTSRVGSGFASVKNVYKVDGGGTRNYMASFMLAETLKYQFMIQSPKDGIWNVQHGKNKTNAFVYNTEAHPFRVVTKKPV
jgi:mannosyl-oligosaccharide alpha-1,2-mannosidase